MIRHLNQLNVKTASVESLSEQAQQLNKLMLSMHQWIKMQHTVNGLEAPNPPKLLEPSRPVINSVSTEPSSSATHYIPINGNSFFNTTASASPFNICPPNQLDCKINTSKSAESGTNMFLLGLMAFIPIAVIILYIYLQNNKKEAEPTIESGTSEEFDDLKVKVDDLLAIIYGLDNQKNQWSCDELDDLIHDYTKLKKDANNGQYKVAQLKILYQELQSIEQEMTIPVQAYNQLL